MCGKYNLDMGKELKWTGQVSIWYPTRFHKYLLVFQKKDQSAYLWPAVGSWIETNPGFQLNKSKLLCLTPKAEAK